VEQAKKVEEKKEKQENLEKRLQKMPQIYMSPTARSLIENIIAHLRSGQQPQQHKAGRRGDEEEREGEGTDLGWDGDEGTSEAEQAEVAKARKLADKALRRRLNQQGWRKEDVDRALAELSDLLPVDDDRGRLKKVLDWLCLHVAEERLPVEFQPAKTLEIGITAFPSAKQPKST
jgi:hypothetical protein